MSGECDECGEHTVEEWENAMIACMSSRGWVNDRNDETTLGFSYKTEFEHWVRDYNKRTRSFIHFNANQKISLVITKVPNGSETN